MEFRKATEADISAITGIYEAAHTEMEQGNIAVGWVRNIYPTEETAKAALQRDDLFVGLDDDVIFGTAIINQQQADVYKNGRWEHIAEAHEVMVLHTFVIDPKLSGRGYGREFVDFYETYALSQGCRYLRMDTQVINKNARRFYKKLDYKEIDVVPCVLHGIEGVQLVLLEKKLELSHQ